MHRIAAVLNLLTQLNKSSINNFIRHECQNGILGGCFFILFDGHVEIRISIEKDKSEPVPDREKVRIIFACPIRIKKIFFGDFMSGT